jgi:hypothetical protein
MKLGDFANIAMRHEKPGAIPGFIGFEQGEEA